MLDWEKLYTMQQQLDSFIEEEKNVVDQPLFDKKVLALLVEVGELANETRCFKFWSDKGPSERSVILEEYVDGVHFLLSLGLEKDFRFLSNSTLHPLKDLTDQFNQVYGSIHDFAKNPTQKSYDAVWSQYLGIGKTLDFSEEDVMRAYLDKNEVNVNRQKQGY